MLGDIGCGLTFNYLTSDNSPWESFIMYKVEIIVKALTKWKSLADLVELRGFRESVVRSSNTWTCLMQYLSHIWFPVNCFIYWMNELSS